MEKSSRLSLEKSVLDTMKQRKRARLIPKTQLEDLPMELIQHIQSFLLVKEAARTCFFSKPWLSAWSTSPNLRFPFQSTPEEKYDSFMKYTLLRYQSNNIPIQSFDLQLTIRNPETSSLAENWFRHVSNPKTCLKELSLDISVIVGSVTLPLEIFSGENLKSITVRTHLNWGKCGLKFLNNSLCSNPVMIKCVSLRVLDLKYVSITDDVLAILLSTCMLLENIRLIWCEDLKTGKVKNLAFLHELKIYLRHPNPILEITDVPVLRMLDYSPLSFGQISKPMPFQMDSFGSVTQLIIGANVLIDDGFFDSIKSKLPLLESLTLTIEKWAAENWVISSVSLKRLNLKFWTTNKQFHIQVHAPNLISCVCVYRWEPAPIISFSTPRPEDYKIIPNKVFCHPRPDYKIMPNKVF